MFEPTMEISLQKHEEDLKSLENRIEQFRAMMDESFEQTKRQIELVGGTRQQLQSLHDELSKKISEAPESLLNRSTTAEVSTNPANLNKVTSIETNVNPVANSHNSNLIFGPNFSMDSQSVTPNSLPTTHIQFGTTNIPLITSQFQSSTANTYPSNTRPSSEPLPCNLSSEVLAMQNYSVPFFGGDPYEFIRGYKEFFKVNPMSEIDMIQYVMHDFEGEALEWYYQYVERKFLDTWTPDCWEDFVLELNERFAGDRKDLINDEDGDHENSQATMSEPAIIVVKDNLKHSKEESWRFPSPSPKIHLSENWESVDLGQSPEATLPAFPPSKCSQHDDVVFRDSAGHPVEIIVVLIEELTGFGSDVYVQNKLINIYAVCGNLDDARRLFDERPVLDSVSWNSIWAGYVHMGDVKEVQLIIDQMPKRNIYASNFMIVLVGQSGRLTEARQLFDEVDEKDLVPWTALICCYEQSELYEEALVMFMEMNCNGIALDEVVMVSELSVCAHLSTDRTGEITHGLGLRIGIDSFVNLKNSLIHMYSTCKNIMATEELFKVSNELDQISWNSMIFGYMRCGSGDKARGLFDSMAEKDIVSMSAMIYGHAQLGQYFPTVSFFQKMLHEDVRPDETTFISMISACTYLAALGQSAMIKACSELGKFNLGTGFHGVVFRHGFDTNHEFASTLIGMYGRNHESSDACRLLDELLKPDSVGWTSVISAFTRNDFYKEALGFFYLMQRNNGLVPDGYAIGSVLTACEKLGRLKQAKGVHAKVISAGEIGNVVVESSLVDMYVVVQSSLVNMYAKCGTVAESQLVFDRMAKKNLVSWSALLGGYCQKADYDTVIEPFRVIKGVNLYSFGAILRSCVGLAAVKQGKGVYSQYLGRGGWRDVVVESTLVDLYAKCGCIDFAYRIFKQMPVRNLVTWNAVNGGLAQNGRGRRVLRMLNKMTKEVIEPDYITYVGVLFACSHTGLVDEGRKYFISMTEKYGIKAGMKHYTCMVDLPGRAEQIEEADELLKKSDFENDSSLWAKLLGACATSRNSTVAERVAKKMMELEPDYYLSYILLANIYRNVGWWNDALAIVQHPDAVGGIERQQVVIMQYKFLWTMSGLKRWLHHL